MTRDEQNRGLGGPRGGTSSVEPADPGIANTVFSAPSELAKGTEDARRTMLGVAAATPPSITQQTTTPRAATAAGVGLAPGTRIQQYELIRELGRGGMGCVYAARDTKLGRRVAMKFLLNASRGVAERFLVEARATAQCSHDNIVIIHEVDEHEGMPYMVLEFLEGQPLGGAVKIAPARVVELSLHVARALARAHELGIVHRDLKPDNVFLTTAGQVKVLDFGIAKALGTKEARPAVGAGVDLDAAAMGLTREGTLVGTMPYMCPEQFGMDEVDHRADLFALGIMMFEMLAGRHPVEPLTPPALITHAANLDTPLPALRSVAPEVPEGLARIVDGCLRKRKQDRIASAAELVRLLEAHVPGRAGRALAEGESPYPGLTAFQEADADRFFGRARDVARMVARVREHPLTGVVGPSGVGKSSFIRAGVGPALKASGEAWDVVSLRPGRQPLAALASVVQRLTTRSGSSDLSGQMAEHEELLRRFRAEPGYLGTLLRSRARQRQGHILLFVDQFEELYTLVPDAEERRAFTAALAGVADDTATPLRVVVSMRADFVDRVAEDPRFMEELQRGLVFLAAPDRAGLRDALVQPVEQVGYRFESEAMVDDMLRALEGTHGALPLLQFAAAKLWDARDPARQLLGEASYHAIGGISGALATHADDVVAQMNSAAQKLTQKIFQRLVTPERTRAIVELVDLQALAPDRAEVARVLDQLVAARLLVVQTRGDAGGGSVEIVHESLIERWPLLQRWLDEDQEDATFLAELRAAAKQWEARGRAAGLLWRGEAMDEARRWFKRRPRELPAREQAFLDAVFALAARGVRKRRIGLIAAFVLLGAIAAGALVAFVWIRGAEQEASANAATAQREMENAKAAMKTAQDALAAKEQKEQERAAAARNQELAEADKAVAEAKAASASAAVEDSAEQLRAKNALLSDALDAAKEQKERAEEATRKAEAASKKAEKAARDLEQSNEALEEKLAIERAARKKAEEEKKKLSTKLK